MTFVKIWHSTLKDYFIVSIANTVTCSISCSISCISLFINVFIYYVSFFATGYYYFGEIDIYNKNSYMRSIERCYFQ